MHVSSSIAHDYESDGSFDEEEFNAAAIREAARLAFRQMSRFPGLNREIVQRERQDAQWDSINDPQMGVRNSLQRERYRANMGIDPLLRKIERGSQVELPDCRDLEAGPISIDYNGKIATLRNTLHRRSHSVDAGQRDELQRQAWTEAYEANLLRQQFHLRYLQLRQMV